MKRKSIILYALLLIVISGCLFEAKESDNVALTKKVFDLNNPIQKSQFDDWVNTNIISAKNDTTAHKYESSSKYSFTGEKLHEISCDFEDANFEIYSGCAGEFGGALLFVDKNNRDKIHFLPSTCPKMIDFKDGKYIITSSLAHIGGSASVIILEKPRRLPLYQKGKSFSNQTSLPDSLLRIVLDTFGLNANVYYPYKNKSFILFSEYDTAYVGEILKGKIINKKPLLSHGIWAYQDKMNRIKNGIYISDINHISTSIDPQQSLEITESIEGTIYIKQDTIVLGYKYSKIVKKEK